MGGTMGVLRRNRRRLVRFWLTLIVLGGAMILGSALGEVFPSPLGSSAHAQEGAGEPEEEGEETRGEHPRQALRDALSTPDRAWVEGGGSGTRVLVFPVHGDIDLGISAFLERALADAGEVDLVVVDIQTFGGRVDAAIQMRDLLMDLSTPTVAFIHPRAISAGALIALSCDAIAIAPGGTIGAAMPINVESGEAEAVGEKYVSYLRTEFASTAERQHRNDEVAAAMVDSAVVIPDLIEVDKLLTLTEEQALEWNVADGRADDVAGLLATLGLQDAALDEPQISWAERLVRFLTNPIVGGLLMSMGMLGIGIELYTPGVGLPGGVGVTCLVLFFFGHFMTHLAGFEEIVLIALGLILLVVEVFVTPGFGVAGISGLLVMALGLLLALLGLDLRFALETGEVWTALLRVFASFGATVLAFAVFLYFAPESRFASRLVLKEKVRGTVVREGGDGGPEAGDELLGQEGVAVGDLRPAGIVRIGDRRVDVVTEGDYVDAGATVRVIEVRGNRVVVREVGS